MITDMVQSPYFHQAELMATPLIRKRAVRLQNLAVFSNKQDMTDKEVTTWLESLHDERNDFARAQLTSFLSA